MNRLIEADATIGLTDSGSIKLALRQSVVKPSPERDDKEGVRLPEGPYRLMLHCGHASESKEGRQAEKF